jgi:hypothetical protein
LENVDFWSQEPIQTHYFQVWNIIFKTTFATMVAKRLPSKSTNVNKIYYHSKKQLPPIKLKHIIGPASIPWQSLAQAK